MSARVRLLAERFGALSEQLATTARDMAVGGKAPTVALSDELDVVRSEFAEVRRLTLDLAGMVGMLLPAPDQLASLSVLEGLVQSTCASIQHRAAEEARQNAMAVLGQVALVRHRDQPHFTPLEEAQVRANQLRANISTGDGAAPPEDVAGLAEERHPFCYLVEFARPRADLDDVRWGLMHDAVASYFGRPLAVAAARGKLVVGDTFDQGSPSSQAAEDEWPTITINTATPKGQIPNGRQPADPSTIADFVWRALLADRPAAAFQLACYLGPQEDASGCPPVWLLRALALSPHLLYVNGDLALELTEAFAQFQRGDLRLAGGDAQVDRSVRLLLRSAALRPSLVAPDTGAWHILGALPDEPGFAHFDHYSRVVSEYGERHRSLSPFAFAPALSTDVWRDNLEDLLREIGAWRVRFLGMRSSFPPAREVWRSWLRPDGLIHSLLAPLTLDPRGLESAQGLAERLSNAAQVRWEIGHTDRRILGRTTGPDVTSQPAATRDLSDRVREAVAFARRWIALQENRPGRPDDEPLRQAKRLRQELSELRPLVVAELRAADATDAPLAARAALGQCLSTISAMDSLLGIPEAHSSDPGQPREEPPPGLLLRRDLLRAPGLQLDDQGRPLGMSPAQLVSALKRILVSDQRPTWQEAFQAHLQRHDHAGTALIIEYLASDDRASQPADLARLRAARTDDLNRCRDELGRQIEATRRRVDTAAAHGRLSEMARGELLGSVELVDIGLSTVVQFEPELARLQRIRGELPDPQDDQDSVEDDRPSIGGRLQERLELAAPDGPCLLVGAPGMGTSDLFQRMAEQRHETLVIDLTAEGTGASEEHDVNRFWRLAGEFLSDPTRQGLLLVDGADRLLEEEAQLTQQVPPAPDTPGLFATSQRLASAMRERDGRLKVVLGGSATVLRAAGLLQHPLSGRGYVQLGPLLDRGDWREAHVLLRQALGDIELESNVVAARILSLANYEPASIWRLAGVLAERCRGRAITDLDLEQLARSRDGARLLTETLQATLACDPRFGVVIYSLALAYWRGLGCTASAGAEGVSARWLREQAVIWWPEGFRETVAVDAFKTMLDQMVVLGLLRQPGADRFVPGRANLIKFLGSEEELIGRLQTPGGSESDDEDSDHDYAAAGLRLRLAGGLAGRSPLTNQQLSAVLGPESGCAIVFGIEAGGLASLTSIGALAGSRTVAILHPPPGTPEPDALLSAIDGELSGLDAQLPVVLLVPPEWTWSGEWVLRVRTHLADQHLDRVPFTRMVFVADPATASGLVQDALPGPQSALTLLPARGVEFFTLAPWRDSAVQQWMTDCGVDADPRTLSDMTGNWPLLLNAYCQGDSPRTTAADVWLGTLELRLATGPRAGLAGSFGLDLPLGKALQLLAAQSDSQDIDVGSERLPDALEWASLLHLAHPVGANRWRLDTVVARLLESGPAGKPQLGQDG